MATTEEREVLSLINTLGFLEKGVYYPEPDCFQNVRELIRYLHRDDRVFTMRRLCVGHNIVRNDLVPLMKSKNVSSELFDAALRICVNLCQPTLVLFNGKLPDEMEEWQIFYELEGGLIRSLAAFADPTIFEVFCTKIKDYFDIEWEDRTEKQRLLVERLFVLIRYVFAIGVEGTKYPSVPEVDTLVHDRVTINFFASGVHTVFLKLAINSMEREFCSYIVAILALIFKSLDPLLIAEGSEKQGELAAKQRLEKEQQRVLEAIKNEEENKRINSQKRRSSGLFVIKGLKALNPGKDFVVCGASGSDQKEETGTSLEMLAQRKRAKPRTRNRKVVDLEVQGEQMRDLSPDTTQAIKEFCLQLLAEGRFNKLMRSTKDTALVGGSRQMAQKLTEFHYFTLATFMLAFARHSKSSIHCVSHVFSVQFFHQITSHLTNCFDLMKTDKEAVRKYALSAQHAVSNLKEVMMMLNYISNATFPADKEYFRQFCTQIFQLEEYRELAGAVLMHLSPAGATHKMLQDLIVANHYLMHVMEKNVKLGELVKVRKRKRQKRRKKAQEKKQREQVKRIEKAMKQSELGTLWQEIREELTDTLSGRIPHNEDASPVNMLLEVDEDHQQAFALLQVQIALRTRRIAEAVGIYRNGRVLWPETGTFGDDQVGPEDEVRALEHVFNADMAEIGGKYTEALQKAYGKSADGEVGDEVAMDSENEENNDEDVEGEAAENGMREDVVQMVESEFDFNDFISSYAKPVVINWYIFTLKKFRTNPREVNLAILKLFHRIAFDLKSPARLYQATLFRVLQEIKLEVHKGIYTGQDRSRHPHFPLFEFGHHLLKKFFGHLRERGAGIIACELLFLKTAREAYEVEHGYGSMD